MIVSMCGLSVIIVSGLYVVVSILIRISVVVQFLFSNAQEAHVV